MVCGYSRWAAAMLLPSLAGGEPDGWLVTAAGRARGGAAGTDPGRRGRGQPLARKKVELTGECQAFRGTLATKVTLCRQADPEAKALSNAFTTTWRPRSCPAAPSPS